MTEPRGQVPRPNDTRPPRLPAGTVPALPPTSAGLSEPPIVSAGRVRWTFGPGSAAPRLVQIPYTTSMPVGECPVCWRSHGCARPAGHPGGTLSHRCDDDCGDRPTRTDVLSTAAYGRTVPLTWRQKLWNWRARLIRRPAWAAERFLYQRGWLS